MNSSNHDHDVPILLVDDEAQILDSERLGLELAGFGNIHCCQDSRAATELFGRYPAAVVVLDLIMPHVSGIELLQWLSQHCPDHVVIMLTGNNDLPTAVKCVKAGAFDYLTKPVNLDRLTAVVRNAVDALQRSTTLARMKSLLLGAPLEHPEAFAEVVTGCPSMLNICRYVEAVGPTPFPLLITGESGTGKELVARAAHRVSARRGDFVCINTAGIDDNLFSDTLFGHRPGAFTGAVKMRQGMIMKAAGGTLFLDEIGELRPESQVKLLRLLQEGTYYPLGAENEERSDARIVAATNRSLDELARSGTFRKDLFYRLRAHHVHLPPLRERLDDIPALTRHFVASAASELGKAVPAVPPELFPLLRNHAYPGNVRELRGLVYDAMSLHRVGTLSMGTFLEKLCPSGATPPTVPATPVEMQFPTPLPTMQDIEEALAAEALRRTNGNKSLAAAMLGITRHTLRTKVRD